LSFSIVAVPARPLGVLRGATGLIGDPSGKAEERALRTEEEIGHNIAAIKEELKTATDAAGADKEAVKTAKATAKEKEKAAKDKNKDAVKAATDAEKEAKKAATEKQKADTQAASDKEKQQKEALKAVKVSDAGGGGEGGKKQ
jgi:hypothetical protein